MSRITQKSSVAPIDPWDNISTGVPSQAFSANPANTPITTAGVGFAGSDFSTYVGQKFDTSDGRELALVSNGTVALGAGKLVQAAAEVTAHQKLAMTVPTAYPATAGLLQILVTNGGTVLNANKFQQGYAVVAAGTGIGQTLKISSHQPAAASATFVVTLEDQIQTTLDATSKISLLQNPYANAIISPTTQTSGPIGVSLYGIAASTAPTFDGTSGALTAAGITQYGLIVTHGPTGCLIDTTTNVGYPLGPSGNTAGALLVATLTTVPMCAISMQTQTTAQQGLVYVLL